MIPLPLAAIHVVIIKILGVVIAILVVIDCVHKIWVYFTAKSCALRSYLLLPDKCEGPCPPATGTCTALTTRSYLKYWTQDATCACVVPVPAGTPGAAAPGGLNPLTNPGAVIDDAKKKVHDATDDHTKKTNDAIDHVFDNP